jgi:signal transduction histidine kinase
VKQSRDEGDGGRLAGELRAAVELREQFLSVASHELKTPLTSLQLQLDGLLGLLRGGEPLGIDRMARKLEVAIRQVDRLTELVDELVDASRISQGRFSVELGDVDLERVVRDVVEHFSAEAARARCPIALRTCGPLPMRGDAFRLEQVVANLISNAIKYGRERGVDVELSADDLRARLVVRDGGIGVAPGDRERIFERFERAVSVHNYGGLGLGLFISREIVEAHGGEIRVEPRDTQGATFVVELPRA